MSVYFGTDGIRGIAGENLTFELAYKCGIALGMMVKNPRVIIGKDTRTSGSHIALSLCAGITYAGASVMDIGTCTTPTVAYLTKKFNADFGIMISASHNPAKYNGIKIFGADGKKLSDEKEIEIEKCFFNKSTTPCFGKYIQKSDFVDLYMEHIKRCIDGDLGGLKIVIDCANGGASKIAPKIFNILNAETVQIACECNGEKINDGCGALHPEVLAETVIKQKADFGFAFDGDADRIVAVDENGNILDGDVLTYILASFFNEQNKLNQNIVVGTSQTNAGLEEELKKQNISLLRANVGDKYVMEQMDKHVLNLGGEKSGHIILSDYATTGDGVLCAVLISYICKTKNKKLSELANINLYPQINIDVATIHKLEIVKNDELQKTIKKYETELPNSRILVRASGTEDVVRIMVELKDEEIAKKIATELKNLVLQINKNC